MGIWGMGGKLRGTQADLLFWRRTARAVEIDTNHFKGNFPDSVTIEAACAFPAEAEDALLQMENRWRTLLPSVKLQAHKQHYFPKELFTGPKHTETVTHVRVRMFPDGGISRIGILGNAQRVNMAISSSAEAAVDKNLEGVDKSRDLVKKARNDTKKND